MIAPKVAVAEGSSSTINTLLTANAPRHIPAVLESLQFGNPSSHLLNQLLASEWRQLLSWCDYRQLTLMLPHICGSSLPPDVRVSIAERTTRYAVRFDLVKRSLYEITDAFNAAGLEFVLLKGLSHAPEMTPDALLRAQGDIDLWLIGHSVYKAREILQSLGYISLVNSQSRHLAPMARPNTWQWRGDLFDPEMPISVELHYELWSTKAEYIEAPQIDQFWARRTLRDFDGHKIHVLCDEDMLGFSALHLLLHLLHGDLPLQRAWEIGRFLHTHADDHRFWDTWRKNHAFQLRQLETAIYCLVSEWFGCRWPPRLSSDVLDLNERLRFWLATFSLSPLIREWKPNKREIWLHLALMSHRQDKAKVLIRRLFPMSLPLTTEVIKGRRSLRSLVRQLPFLSSRFIRHLVTLVPTVFDGLRLLMLHKL